MLLQKLLMVNVPFRRKGVGVSELTKTHLKLILVKNKIIMKIGDKTSSKVVHKSIMRGNTQIRE